MIKHWLAYIQKLLDVHLVLEVTSCDQGYHREYAPTDNVAHSSHFLFKISRENKTSLQEQTKVRLWKKK